MTMLENAQAMLELTATRCSGLLHYCPAGQSQLSSAVSGALPGTPSIDCRADNAQPEDWADQRAARENKRK
jgi:hypothetical protein